MFGKQGRSGMGRKKKDSTSGKREKKGGFYLDRVPERNAPSLCFKEGKKTTEE